MGTSKGKRTMILRYARYPILEHLLDSMGGNAYLTFMISPWILHKISVFREFKKGIPSANRRPAKLVSRDVVAVDWGQTFPEQLGKYIAFLAFFLIYRRIGQYMMQRFRVYRH